MLEACMNGWVCILCNITKKLLKWSKLKRKQIFGKTSNNAKPIGKRFMHTYHLIQPFYTSISELFWTLKFQLTPTTFNASCLNSAQGSGKNYVNQTKCFHSQIPCWNVHFGFLLMSTLNMAIPHCYLKFNGCFSTL